MNKLIKILLIDDHTLFRQGLAFLLEQESNFEIIAMASSGLEGIKLAEKHHPDIVLLDIDMPVMSGFETLAQLINNQPNLAVLMLTISERIESLNKCLSLGARGYIIKNIESDFLIQAIYRALNGHQVFSPEMAAIYQSNLHKTKGKIMEPLNLVSSLTQRELEVLQFIAKGISNKVIAYNLSISENTIKVHVQNILKKLNLNSRTQAAIFANQHQL